MVLDLQAIRARFPALARIDDGQPAVWLDGPGGTQVPIDVIEATAELQRRGVSNHGGSFAPSREGEHLTSEARQAMADLFGCDSHEVVFGQNMTSLTFAASRAIGATWQRGDRVVVTSLDHDANVSPWLRAASDAGAEVVTVPFDSATGRLDPQQVVAAIDERTRLVAVTAASNALGSVTDLPPILAAAREHGALSYVDAVHYSAHRLSDVSVAGPDFLVASAYKFFGPHTGIMYARSEHLANLAPYKVRPAPEHGGERWETGTQSFESLVGVTAAVDYLASLGSGPDRRSRLVSAFGSISDHEDALSRRFLSGLSEMPAITLYGPSEVDGGRVSTFALAVAAVPPGEVAARLGRHGIYVWSGHYYAIGVMEQLGLLDKGGLVRIGFVHYTSQSEVDRVLQALSDITATA